MYPTVTHIKSGKPIQLFSPEVNKLLDDDYTIEEILKTFTYNTNKYQMVLPKEINKDILLLLSDVDLCQMFLTNSYFYKLVKDIYFWHNRLYKIYHVNTVTKNRRYEYIKLTKLHKKINKIDSNQIIIEIPIHESYDMNIKLNFKYQFKNNRLKFQSDKNFNVIIDCILSLCTQLNHSFTPSLLTTAILSDIIYTGLKYKK